MPQKKANGEHVCLFVFIYINGESKENVFALG